MLGAPQPRRYDALTPREQRFEANKVMSWVPTPDSALRRVGGRKRERERDQLALYPNASTSALNLAVFCNMLSLHHTIMILPSDVYLMSAGCASLCFGHALPYVFNFSAGCTAKPPELGASTQNKGKIIRR